MTHQIVPENILALFPGRAVNFHPAILPHYRGPNPRAGMILDGKADLYGGITLHCLSRGIDRGDIIAMRKVPHNASRGFIHWDVCLARTAADLVQTDLQSYLQGTLRPCAQDPAAGNYRKVSETEKTLSDAHSASRSKWLCDQLAAPGWVRFVSRTGKKYVVAHFVRRVGPRSFRPEKLGRFTIEFDAADARVSVLRRRLWTRLWQAVRYWVEIARTSRTQ
jgi:methionyl-tRNA formyltransferase